MSYAPLSFGRVGDPLESAALQLGGQLGYEFAKPVLLPKGTRLESIAHFDNSENNPYNPNPKIDVPYGPQSTDEMAVSFIGFVIDREADPTKLIRRRSRSIIVAAERQLQ